ncbi:MAG: Fic family protein [Candidatus Solibacter usitatus]|nr:Fic family protein [Candidatus Solibacter usitatus]
MADYHWKPIVGITEKDRRIDLETVRPLYENWRASRKRLQESSQARFAEFNKRLIRRLSVETGILERLYDLDRGTTEALVANGFLEDLVSHSSTNIEPARLIDILRDQEAAVQLVVDCVTRNRDLTKGLFHELHVILTRHQDSTTAVDQFGNRREIPLLKGKFKEQPNNPKRPDGTIHEYCPPIHVDSEVDSLLQLYQSYAQEDPILLSAWLHHRFTQIHPYQDGNGRVARALTTLVLLRAELLPLVVDRDLRAEYIRSLELADQEHLSNLTEIFARLEKNAILQALSVDSDAALSQQKSLTSAVIGSLSEKFGKRRLQKLVDLRHVNAVASELRAMAHVMIEKSFVEVKPTLGEIGEPAIYVHDGGPDKKNSHWYKFEVAQSAKEYDRFANFSEEHYFIKGLIRVNTERLTFVVSFHHVGRELSGIMEATAFSKLESYDDAEDRESVSERFSLCSVEPFVFTHLTKSSDVSETFRRWLDTSLAIAMKEYGDRL